MQSQTFNLRVDGSIMTRMMAPRRFARTACKERTVNVTEGIEWSHLSSVARRPKLNQPKPRPQVPTTPSHFSAGGSSGISDKDSAPSPKQSIPIAQLSDVLNTNRNPLEQLLPRERLPFPVDEDLLRKLSAPIGTNRPIWNEIRSSFSQPPRDFGEVGVCEWLNNIGATMGLAFGRQCKRLWWSGSCASGGPLVDSSIHQVPGVVLLDRDYHDRVSHKLVPGLEWVKAFAGVHQRPNAHCLTDAINFKSHHMLFLCQPHRRFTISLFFINSVTAQFSITVTDRAGQVRIATKDLMEPSVDNGLLLLWVLAFLMFGRLEDIGLDPYFEIDPSNGEVIAIECENRRFEIVECIHVLHSLFGRGTQVWIVVHNGIKYIMKDSWVREDGLHNEVSHLRRMSAYKELQDRVPTLICGGDVVINGTKDSTQRYRNTMTCGFHHVHRRIVTSPIGESIISFKSKKEFIRVMISLIETHRYLYDHLKILHCDVSLSNVLLNRKNDESEATGLLIDYDYSIDADQAHTSDKHAPENTLTGERVLVAAGDTLEGSAAVGVMKAPSETPLVTGTPPYMAIEALLGTNTTFIHKPQHDLESILYIILYMCTFVWGPGLPLYKLDIPPMSPLRTWFNNDRITEIGLRKLTHLQCYDIAILPNFTPYWRDFAPFVKHLILACFPVDARLPSKFRYEWALRILEKAYNSVKEPTDLTFNGLVSGPQHLKRPNIDSLHQDTKKGRYSLLS